jgi:acetyl-CoA carboxylase carboxyl transferase subunit alpha
MKSFNRLDTRGKCREFKGLKDFPRSLDGPLEYIPFEKPIADLEHKIDELRRMASAKAIDLSGEICELESKAKSLRREMFAQLTAYETTQLSRHPRRPNTVDLINKICSVFVELHGDRNFLDDKAIVGGLAKIGDQSIVVIGHQKGRDTKDNIYRNFGMPRPEGYRKALRLMSMAERFGLPIVTFIDTPGAYPGIGAEERGQSEAIAKNIMVMSRLKIPIISIVVGEGGSGGALALGVANRVHMLRHSIYSVISPEGCASILMNDAGKASQAAEALKVTATQALEFSVIDSVIDEPEGGAHRSLDMTALSIKEVLERDLAVLLQKDGDTLREERMNKYLGMGLVSENPIL